jgi:hypothetical protein
VLAGTRPLTASRRVMLRRRSSSPRPRQALASNRRRRCERDGRVRQLPRPRLTSQTGVASVSDWARGSLPTPRDWSIRPQPGRQAASRVLQSSARPPWSPRSPRHARMRRRPPRPPQTNFSYFRITRPPRAPNAAVKLTGPRPRWQLKRKITPAPVPQKGGSDFRRWRVTRRDFTSACS